MASNTEHALNKALTALFLATDADVARDVVAKVRAREAELEARIAELGRSLAYAQNKTSTPQPTPNVNEWDQDCA